MELPHFKYHPDPLASGSIAKSPNSCRCCGKVTGFIYTGPTYAETEIDREICPWCIADGSAARKFEAVFVDPAGFGDGEVDLSPEVESEVSCRTPGFSGWQQERWLACCDTAAAFIGPAGLPELEVLGPNAQEAVQQEAGLQGDEWDRYFSALDRERGPTAYIFRCLKCGRLLAYSDNH